MNYLAASIRGIKIVEHFFSRSKLRGIWTHLVGLKKQSYMIYLITHI